jgi:hypothetical protein
MQFVTAAKTRNADFLTFFLTIDLAGIATASKDTQLTGYPRFAFRSQGISPNWFESHPACVIAHPLGFGGRQGGGLEGLEESIKRVDVPSSGGFEDGANIGVELGAPFGSEAVGYLAERHARP